MKIHPEARGYRQESCGEIQAGHDLTSLDTKMIVMQILTAARESAKTGRTVELRPLPE